MTEILHIDSTSTLQGVRRQLAGQRGERVVLELPANWSELDNAARLRLLNGWDDIQMTLSLEDRIAQFQLRDKVNRPWAMVP